VLSQGGWDPVVVRSGADLERLRRSRSVDDERLLELVHQLGSLTGERQHRPEKAYLPRPVSGQPQPAGTYVWMLRFVERDTQKKVFLKGTTILVR